VLFVSTWDTACGIAMYTASLRAGLERHGVATDVVSIDRDLITHLSRSELTDYFVALAAQARPDDVVHVQHEFGFFAASYGMPESHVTFGRFLKETRRRAAGAVVTFHSPPVVPGWPKPPWPSSVRDALLYWQWRRRVAPQIGLGRIQAVTPSLLMRRTVVDSGCPPGAVHFVPQGAPPVDGDPAGRMAAKESLDYDGTGKLLAIFGFISRYKGYRTALAALRALPAHYELVVLGGQHPYAFDDGYEMVLKDLRRYPDLRDRVRITGFLPENEVRTYLTAADVCLLPYNEARLATSGAAMWALASGRPVVASSIPAFRELHQAAGCLQLVHPKAPNELAAAIEVVVDDERLAKKLVDNATAYCEANSWTRIAHAHLPVYELAGRRSGQRSGRR
jgi:glycosyltransferase involved in cell wall biosynthesis